MSERGDGMDVGQMRELIPRLGDGLGAAQQLAGVTDEDFRRVEAHVNETRDGSPRRRKPILWLRLGCEVSSAFFSSSRGEESCELQKSLGPFILRNFSRFVAQIDR